MLEILGFILVTILWIIIGTSYLKINPIITLLIAALLLSFLIGIPITEIHLVIGSGFWKTVKNIGLLIIFGTVIGSSLELSKGTVSIASGLIKLLKNLPLPYAISTIGYFVSIPVFCDAAFVILSNINKTLSKKTKTSLVGLSVALSTGLFAPHVLVPPTPGPLAAASNLALDNLFLLIICGGLLAFILSFCGGVYGQYLSKKEKNLNLEGSLEVNFKIEKNSPSFNLSISPIIVPIILMCLGSFLNYSKANLSFSYLLNLITNPNGALLIGVLISFFLKKNDSIFLIKNSLITGFKNALPIILITGVGGSLGAIIQYVSIESYLESFTSINVLSIIIPFAIAAVLKTAQGSSTVAIITTSTIIFPLLPALGLDSEMGKVWAIMSLGVGSMTISHANDSYFWIVSQMSEMDVKTAYKTHTVGTFFQGALGFFLVLIGYLIWSSFK